MSSRIFRTQALSKVELVAIAIVAVLSFAQVDSVTGQVPVDDTLKDFKVVRVLDDSSFEIRIDEGPGRGRWRVDLDSSVTGLRQGRQGRIATSGTTLEKRKGDATLRFKGSDEELQAFVQKLANT